MTVINVSSQLGPQLQQLELDIETGVLAPEMLYGENISEFGNLQDTVSPTVLQLSSTQVRLRYISDDDTYFLTMTGSGIGPVTSLADLEAAIDASLATGDINRVTLQRAFGGSTTTILRLDTTTTGYTLTTGADVLTITGSLPASFGDLFELDDLLDGLDMTALAAMDSTARAAYFAALAGYGITGISLSTGGDTLLAINLTSTALTLTVGNLELEIAGTLPADFGQMAEVAFDLFTQGETLGLPMDLSAITGLGVDEITLRVVGGADLMVITGPITDEASLLVEAFYLDGVERSPTVGLNVRSPEAGDIFGTIDFLDNAGEVSFGSINTTVGDTIWGGYSADYIFGLGGNDALDGYYGDDAIYGGDGNDQLSGGFGNDTIDGGAGNDILIFGFDQGTSQRNNTVNLQLTRVQTTGEGKDLILGIEHVDAGGGHDRIIGSSGRNWLFGNDGDDTLRGGAGIDTLVGGFGDDELEGGAAADVLTGDWGADRFLFSATSGSDRVTDFEDGIDRIQIAGFTFANVTIADSGADVLITFGTARVRLSGVDHNLITADDFLFT